MVILLQGNVLQIFLRKWSWSIRGNPGILLGRYKAQQTIVRTAEVLAKLRTGYFLNTINTRHAPCDANAWESCAVAGSYQFQYPQRANSTQSLSISELRPIICPWCFQQPSGDEIRTRGQYTEDTIIYSRVGQICCMSESQTRTAWHMCLHKSLSAQDPLYVE
jgi:hypothetical protein